MVDETFSTRTNNQFMRVDNTTSVKPSDFGSTATSSVAGVSVNVHDQIEEISEDLSAVIRNMKSQVISVFF